MSVRFGCKLEKEALFKPHQISCREEGVARLCSSHRGIPFTLGPNMSHFNISKLLLIELPIKLIEGHSPSAGVSFVMVVV